MKGGKDGPLWLNLAFAKTLTIFKGCFVEELCCVFAGLKSY